MIENKIETNKINSCAIVYCSKNLMCSLVSTQKLEDSGYTSFALRSPDPIQNVRAVIIPTEYPVL